MKFSAYKEEVKETREPVAFIDIDTLYIKDRDGGCFAIYCDSVVEGYPENVWNSRFPGASKVFYPGDKIVIEV